MDCCGLRMFNPLWHRNYSATGKCVSYTEYERVNDSNCAMVRSTIRDYVKKRVAGTASSSFGKKSDVLSLMIANSDVFEEEDIVDEMMDFMVAATQTSQMTSQYALSHLITNADSLSRVRAEFEEKIDPKVGLTIETVSDLTYLGYVLQEALRLNPVANYSSPYHFPEDTRLGSLVVKAHEVIFINIMGLHLNANQW